MSGEGGFVLVCGLGTVGFRVVELLCRLGEPVRVVTLAAREERLRATEARGVTVLHGDARDEALLARAGLAEAKALIATSDQDLVNLEIALDAKRSRPELPVVIRLFDQELAQKLEGSFEIRRALAVSALAAPTFAAAALGERWVRSFGLGGESFVVGRVQVDEASPLANLTVREIGSRHRLAVSRCEDAVPAPEVVLRPGLRATVLGTRAHWQRLLGSVAAPRRRPRPRFDPRPVLRFARRVWENASGPLRTAFLALLAIIGLSVVVFRFALKLSLVDAFYFIITTVTTTGYGDITPRESPAMVKLYACLVMILGSATTATLYSIITDYLVTARFQQMLGRNRLPREGHVVVAGLGDVGFRTVGELVRAGAEVVAITREAEGELVEATRSQAAVVVGDARQREILLRAGLDRAAAVVSVTSDDAVNLGVALAARELRPGIRTAVRLFDADFAAKARAAFQLDAALSASLLAAPKFVAAALYPDVCAAFLESERFFVALRAARGEEWAGFPPSQLQAERALVVLLRESPEGAWTVSVDDAPIRPGERLVVMVSRPLGE